MTADRLPIAADARTEGTHRSGCPSSRRLEPRGASLPRAGLAAYKGKTTQLHSGYLHRGSPKSRERRQGIAETCLFALHAVSEHTMYELAELFSASRSTAGVAWVYCFYRSVMWTLGSPGTYSGPKISPAV